MPANNFDPQYHLNNHPTPESAKQVKRNLFNQKPDMIPNSHQNDFNLKFGQSGKNLKGGKLKDLHLMNMNFKGKSQSGFRGKDKRSKTPSSRRGF